MDSLREMVREVIREPNDVQTRMEMAKWLLREGWLRAAEDVIVATIQAASWRGDFFSALAMCRLYLPQEKQERPLRVLARRFSSTPQKAEEEEAWLGRRLDPLKLRGGAPHRLHLRLQGMRLPSEPYELVQAAHRIGMEIGDVVPLSAEEIAKIPIFQELDYEEFLTFARCIEPCVLQPGQSVINQGEREPCFYLLSHGAAIVEQERADGSFLQLAEVSAPTYVGEMSLLTQLPHRASVYVTCESVAWRISLEQIAFLSEKHPEILEQLQEIIQKRYIQNLLRLGLAEERLLLREELLQAFQVRIAAEGEVLYEQGEAPPGLFVVLHGEAHIQRRSEGSAYQAKEILGEGDIFGEYSLLTQQPTRLSVTMPQGGILLHLPFSVYQFLRDQIPDLEAALRGLLSQRIRHLPELFDPLPNLQSAPTSSWLTPDPQRKK